MEHDLLVADAARYPGEWVAISHGEIVAHGPDFDAVAQEACQKARDIVFELIPDTSTDLWRPLSSPDPSLLTH